MSTKRAEQNPGTTGFSAPMPARAQQAGVACLLLLWRLVEVPAASLGRDWLFVLSAFWLVSVLDRRGTSRPTLAVSAMAYLLGMYVIGQAPYTLAALGVK